MLWEVLEIGEVFRRDTTYQTPIKTYYINILYLILHNTDRLCIPSEMEGQTPAANHTEAEAQNTVHRGHYKDKGIAVFTSGGDAQGINQ